MQSESNENMEYRLFLRYVLFPPFVLIVEIEIWSNIFKNRWLKNLSIHIHEISINVTVILYLLAASLNFVFNCTIHFTFSAEYARTK